jgi:hypothetical protein
MARHKRSKLRKIFDIVRFDFEMAVRSGFERGNRWKIWLMLAVCAIAYFFVSSVNRTR